MCKTFYFKKYHFDEEKGLLSLFYGVDDKYDFVETVSFPDMPAILSDEQRTVLDHIFFLMHIAWGITYYKAFLSPEIKIESGVLTEEERSFFERFYLNGLGEFSVKNNLHLNIHFPHTNAKQKGYPTVPLADAALVPLGGGKDSAVVIELLKGHIPVFTIAMGHARPIIECARVADVPYLEGVRQIDPQLLELNKTGTVYNGHVPITGLLAFFLWAESVLKGIRFVAMGCERSANVGNMIWDGHQINHQYSKSIEFERDFEKLTRPVTPSFKYFSLLRPLSEIHIAKLFADRCRGYFDVFTSCNKAFKLDLSKRLDRWCGHCDKCRFVFLILAPFMDKNKLVQIVGNNPLNDPEQIKGYEELLGLSGHKPFECVGEVEECRWAFNQIAGMPQWQNDAVVHALKDRVNPADEQTLFTPSVDHLLPKEFEYVMFEFGK